MEVASLNGSFFQQNQKNGWKMKTLRDEDGAGLPGVAEGDLGRDLPAGLPGGDLPGVGLPGGDLPEVGPPGEDLPGAELPGGDLPEVADDRGNLPDAGKGAEVNLEEEYGEGHLGDAEYKGQGAE